ncbi:MAG: hypothetical protein ACREME_05485, partial [Gemmatimonadales bacterium]
MPIVSDLDAAMMHPARFVPAVRHLGGGSIRMNDAGRPLQTVGRDAVVYELRTPTGRILALRCLLHADAQQDAALAARYSALHDDPRLERLRGAGGSLPRGIRWIDEGIALPGPDLHRMILPLMAMERIPGRTLALTVDRLCREGHAEPLALLADGWLATATWLEEAGFSHGDLAADNLMVRPDGSIALVDLDTAAWPAAPPLVSPSEGTPGYAHPRGLPRDPARRDRFPALILWASLRVLARHPHLRQRWGDPPDRHGATLLWSPDDLRRPGRSALFAALDALDDEALAPLLEVVRRAIRFPPDETPPLAEVAERLSGLGAFRPASPSVRDKLSGLGTPATPPRLSPESVAPIDSAEHSWDDGNASVWPLPSVREGRHPAASQTTTLVERERRRA